MSIYCLSTVSAAYSFFFFNVTTTTELYTLSLHDALPIFPGQPAPDPMPPGAVVVDAPAPPDNTASQAERDSYARSEEHTSELQSRFDLVCRLLLEKKK